MSIDLVVALKLAIIVAALVWIARNARGSAADRTDRSDGPPPAA